MYNFIYQNTSFFHFITRKFHRIPRKLQNSKKCACKEKISEQKNLLANSRQKKIEVDVSFFGTY